MVKSKYLKRLFLIGVFLALGLWLFRSSTSSYYSSSLVTYTKEGYPQIEVEFGERKYPLTIAVGSPFSFLSQEALKEIDAREQQGSLVEWGDIKGQRHQSPSYLISEMKIGELALTNILVNRFEEEEKEFGSLGQCLGKEINLLLDLPRNRVVACDSFSKLKEKQLVDDGWIRVPLEIARGTIVLRVNTTFGEHPLMLNTTSSHSMVHSSLLPQERFPITSDFMLGEKNLGPLDFYPIDWPERYKEVNGVIGLNFLKRHAVYIDYSNKFVYIEPPKEYLERFPVTFAQFGIPSIKASVEEKDYLLNLDLGGSFLFCLNKEILEKIRKSFIDINRSFDFKGNKYASPCYNVPMVKMGSLNFDNARVKEQNEEFLVNATLGDIPPDPRAGVIGRSFLERYNLFLDFRNSAIYACDSYSHLLQEGLLSKDVLKIPFKRHTQGILLSVETDDGVRRFLLDTGSSHIFLRAPCSTSTSRFCIEGHDFGPRSILPLELDSAFDCDGLLGMDFLREHSFFIDYWNSLIYLDLKNERKD